MKSPSLILDEEVPTLDLASKVDATKDIGMNIGRDEDGVHHKGGTGPREHPNIGEVGGANLKGMVVTTLGLSSISTSSMLEVTNDSIGTGEEVVGVDLFCLLDGASP